MVDVKKAVSGGVITMIAFIISIIAMFVGLLFLPLLNGTCIGNGTVCQGNTNTFMTTASRDLLEQVYPVLMVLIPLFVLIGGLTVSVVLAKN